MAALITDKETASYQKDGVVLIRNLLDQAWLDVLAEGVEHNATSRSKRTIEYVNDASTNGHFFYDARIIR